MRRPVQGGVVLIVFAAMAGCQMTGMRALRTPIDDLSVDRFFPVKFGPVKIAMEDIMYDHDAMREIAGFDYSSGVTTSSWSWKGAFHKVAHRDMQCAGRSLKVKAEQQEDGCLVTVRMSTGDAKNDLARSTQFLERVAKSLDMDDTPAPRQQPPA